MLNTILTRLLRYCLQLSEVRDIDLHMANSLGHMVGTQEPYAIGDTP